MPAAYTRAFRYLCGQADFLTDPEPTMAVMADTELLVLLARRSHLSNLSRGPPGLAQSIIFTQPVHGA